MKVNFSTIPFKADLLIDNRSKNSVLKSKGQDFQDDFRHSTTQNQDEFLIMVSCKDQNEDKFRLFNSSDNTMTDYQSVFSKFLDKLSYENALKRLVDIYNLMKIKAGHSKIIEDYKAERAKYVSQLNAITGNPYITEHQVRKAMSTVYENLIEDCDKAIRYEDILQKSEIDSFEIEHNLKADI